MVFEGVLVDVLNHFLRPYVKNLDASQLKIAIWSGDVLLENLELKENVLDDLNLPVRVFRGYLERLKLKIPWKNLYSAPITVEVDGLYAVAGPATAVKYNAERDAKEIREKKEKQLKRIEEARMRAEEPKDGKASQDPGFVEKLITQMVRNVQITVKNIHIHYEDGVTNPSHPFSFGVTLDSLFVQSTDSDYVVGGQAADPDPTALLIYKLLQLNCLAVYWKSNAPLMGTSPPDNWMELLKRDIARPDGPPADMQYVVHPITLEAKLQLTTKPGRDMDIPQALVEVSLQKVALALEKSQFHDVMGLVESFDRMSINQKFLKYRPEVSVREDTGQWWRYAITAVREEEVKRKLDMWSWKHMKQHREWCRQYTEAYARKQLAKSVTPALQKELEDLEMKLDVFNLTICRQLAESKVKQYRRVQEEREKAEGGSGWWGWATGWMGGGEKEEGEEIVRKPSGRDGGQEKRIVCTPLATEEELQEEKEKLYEAIGYSEEAQVSSYPKEYVAHKVGLHLDQVSLQLRDEEGIVANVLTSSVKVGVQNRPSSKSLSVQTLVGRLSAHGCMRRTGKEEEEIEKGEGPIIIASRHDEDDLLLSVFLDIKPVDSPVDQRIKVLLLPVQVTYHADTVDAAIGMFILAKDVQLQKLSAAAASTIEDIKTQGRAGLEHAISQRRLLDLDITINSPCVLVPQNGVMSSSSSVIVADFGRLDIKSDLKSSVPDVREATKEELDEAFYDHFNLKLSRLQILMAGPGEDWRDGWSADSSPLHLLEPTGLELWLKKSLLPNDMRLPNLKVGGELPTLSLKLSDKKIKQLLQLVQSLPLPPPSLAEKRLEPSSTYSLPDQPSRMDTGSIVDTISETLLIPKEEEEGGSSEEYETASEGEEDSKGVVHHREKGEETVAVASTTKLSLQFRVNKIGILFSEYQQSSGHDNPRLHLLVTSVTSQVLLRSWDLWATASVGDLHIIDHYATGLDGPGTLLSTELAEGEKFLRFSYSKFDHKAPQYTTVFQTTRQSLSASLSLLRLHLHRESLLNLLDIGRSISTVLKTKGAPGGEMKEEKAVTASPSSPETEDVSVPERLPGERDLHLEANLAGVEVVVAGDDMGEVMSASVKGLETHVDMCHDHMLVHASMADVSVVDREQSHFDEKIISRVNEAKKIITLKLTLFKPSSPRPPSDLDSCDLDLQAEIERLRITILFRFLGRVKNFATHFINQLKLDQTTIDSAREAASQTATRTAEALKERSSSRVRLNITVQAPLLVIPYCPSILSPSSSTSPPPPLPLGAIVANLGVLTVQNKFCLASDMAATKTSEPSPPSSLPSPASPFLSPIGLPAIVDCMNVKISSVQLTKVLDLKEAGGDLSCDEHVILKPLQFQGQVTRKLSDWCKALPAVSIASEIEAVQMQFSPSDYQALMSILRDMKELQVERKDEVEEKEEKEKEEKQRVEESSAPDRALVESTDGKRGEGGEGGGEASSQGDAAPPDVHVEAMVGALELVLHTGGLPVAEMRVNRVAAAVDVFGFGICVKAGISAVEVLDCSQVLYQKIISVEEDKKAVAAEVVLYSSATKGEGYFDTSKSDLSVSLDVQRIRVVALYLFVVHILNYLKQLQETELPVELSSTPAEKITDAVETPLQDSEPSPHPEPQKRIKLDVSIRAPEITVPLSSQTTEIIVLDLGQLTLENEFHLIDVGQNKALYEQYQVKLTDLEMYRSVWDSEGHKPTNCRRGLLEPVTLCLKMERNLSTHWYHGMPTVSVDAQLEPLQVVASADDIEALCKIVNGNLKESPDRGESLEERPSQISLESTGPSKHEPTAESKKSVQEGKEQFTTLLASAKLGSIGIKLYYKGHALALQDASTWVREERKELTGLVLKNFQTSVSMENNGAMSARVTMEDCLLDDLRPTTEEEEEEEEEGEEDESLTLESSVDAVDVGEKPREQRISRLIQRRESSTPNPPPLISLSYDLSQDKDSLVSATIDGVQMLANLKFIQLLATFVQEAIEPLTAGPDREMEEEDSLSLHRSTSRPAHLAAERGQKEQDGPEKKVQVSVKVLHPLIALLENARVIDSNALVLQTEVHVDVSLKLPSNKMSVHSSVTGLSISTARYPHLDKRSSKNVLEPLPDNILAYLDRWEGSTNVSITVPSLTFVLSPAAVRLILGSIQSLSLQQDDQDKVGETAPSDLWTSKPLSQRSLRRKWYFKEKVEEEKKIQVGSSVDVATSSAGSIAGSRSQGQSEYLSMDIANITVLVEQEVTTPTLRSFPALSLMMGKYGSKALAVELQNWSSQLTAHASLSLEVSYYNIRTDSWEPILEPIVDPNNENRYMSWNMQADVRMSTSTTQGGGAGEKEEDEEEEEGSAALSVTVFTKNALQLTVTKTSLGIFNELWQAYTEKRVFEEVDTPETLDAAFAVVNKLGTNYPVTVKPQQTLKVHGAYSPIVRQGDSPLPLHPLEGTVQMRPGELLPRDSHLRRVHIVQLQIPNFNPLDVALGMYEKVYYPLTPWHPGDTEMKIGIVVDIDRTTETPTVTLRSPLQVHNHLDESVSVYHSGIHSPPLPTASAAGRVPPGSTAPLPLDASGGGYLYFQLKSTGMSQQAASWKEDKSLDIACPLVPSEGGEGSHKEDMFYIHSNLVEEEYSRTPSFSLSNRAHHIVHLYHPLVVHNLLPHTIVVAEGHSFSRISSGCEAAFTNVNLTSSHKLQVEVEEGRSRWTGHFSMGPKTGPETSFKVTGPDSRKLELTVKKEEKGTWHLSVFSRYWMVNKSGLTLEYKAGESFFGQRSSDVFLHGPKTPITLFPYEEVCVCVLKDGRRTEWSDKFSLDTLGSEGIFSCHFKDSKEEFQIGTKVEMSKFGISRIITLSPFYIINNETRDDISLREYGLDNAQIYTVPAGEALSFWPQGDTEKLTVAVADPLMKHSSAPFTFTDTRSLLVRTGEHEVPALEIEIQVTGSANIITFVPYFLGCVPLQLVNLTDHTIHFRQNTNLMYTWDDPQANRQLVWRVQRQTNKFTISPEDGSGVFQMPTDTGSAVDAEPLSPLLEGGEDEVDTGEVAEREEEEVEEEEVEEGEGEIEDEGEEGEDVAVEGELDEPEPLEEESVREKEDRLSELPGQPKPTTGGTDTTDFSLRRAFRGFTTGVGKTIKRSVVRKKRKKPKKDHKGYWISFMDGLQRVVLFTLSKELKERVELGRGTEPPRTELSLSLIGTGLSLVDDEKGQEIAYIGIPQSQREWQIRVKKLWKAIPPELNEKIEAAYHDPSMRGKEKKPLPDTEHDINFHRMYLYDKKGHKNKLRRRHFEGVFAQITLSEHLTTINVRISHVQVDNQLPFALNPIILYPYPPPPSLASKCAPKPFIESTIIIRKTEQSNVKQIEYLQALIQEMGVNVDMSFMMAMLSLLAQLPSTTTEAQMVERDVKFARLSLKESKVAAVSAAASRNYFKYLHLSPLDIHLSFSLERSDYDEEAKKASEMNIILTVMFNVLTTFATLFGKTKDAELRLGYFELKDVTLTQQALIDRITKHYMQQGATQIYSIVLGLEVLGNPVGFIKGFKDGAISLFYHPIQGAVLGPEEFFEGVYLGGRQFVGGTIGGISGVLGKVTGVLGDTTAKLTMDEEFLARRRQGSGSVGQGLEGAAKGVFEGVTGLVSQPIKGAKKEGLWGLVKGTGKGVLGLVLRPTGGLIDLTSATFNAVQKKTKVGDYEVTQLRPPRFIGQPKIVYPYSPHKAEGYALFTEVDRGRLMKSDVYFDHVELVENPLKVLLITNNQLVVIKYSKFLDRWDDDWQVTFKEMCGQTKTEGSTIVFTVLEEQGGFGGFLSSKKKTQQASKLLKVQTPQLAEKASRLVNQAFQEYSVTQTPQKK